MNAIVVTQTTPGAPTAVLATPTPDFILEDPFNRNVIIIYVSDSRIKVYGNKHTNEGIVKTLFDMLTSRFPRNPFYLKTNGFSITMQTNQHARIAQYIHNKGWKAPIPIEKKRKIPPLN